MDNNKWIASAAEVFTLSLVFISLFNLALRGDAAELSRVSELFALCGQGISFRALGELLLLSVMIAAARVFWFSSERFKNMLMFVRVTLMLISVFVMAAGCSALFGWFPVGMWQAWLGFTVSVAVGTAVSFTLMLLRSRAESRRYQHVLHQFQSAGEEEVDTDGSHQA